MDQKLLGSAYGHLVRGHMDAMRDVLIQIIVESTRRQGPGFAANLLDVVVRLGNDAPMSTDNELSRTGYIDCMGMLEQELCEIVPDRTPKIKRIPLD